MFAIAGLLALFIALGTVSFQAIKAAVANAVKNLRGGLINANDIAGSPYLRSPTCWRHME